MFVLFFCCVFFFFQAEDGIRDRSPSRGLGDVYKRQEHHSEYSFYVSDAAEKFRKFANTVMPFDVPTTNVVNIEEY